MMTRGHPITDTRQTGEKKKRMLKEEADALREVVTDTEGM
jgi:hypothetical protein